MAEDSGEPVHPRPLMPAAGRRLLRLWRAAGLTTQFMFLVLIMVILLSVVSDRVQNTIAQRNMIESSLEVEQVLAHTILLSVLEDVPLQGALPDAIRSDLETAVRTTLNTRYINKIKLWNLTGSLIYDSDRGAIRAGPPEPAVLQALAGATVISETDVQSVENRTESGLGSLVYEVYMPLYGASGRLLGVGEIYCSIELPVARISQMLQEIDRIRLVVMIVGLLGLFMLVYFAQQRIVRQEAEILLSLHSSRRLAQTNARLLQDSERLRRSAAEASEKVLNQIGAELHDGPVQLLSIATLYRSQITIAPADRSLADRAQGLTDQALAELRNIARGLVLPELQGLGLKETVARAISAFCTDTGCSVEQNLDIRPLTLPLPKQVVSYRIVHEALQNARKHADGRGMRVTLKIRQQHVEIVVSDDGPAEPPPKPAGAEPIRLGLIGMQNRANSVGGTLTIEQRASGGTHVILLLPLRLDPDENFLRETDDNVRSVFLI